MMTGQKWYGYQGIGAAEQFEYENTRSDFKCCCYCEKKQTMHVRLAGIPSGIFRQNYLWYGFTDEPVTSSIRCSSCRKYFCR